MDPKPEQGTKPEKPSSQLTELPGETWEDIFFPPPKPKTAKQMTGADWDAILGRTPRSQETD